MSDLKTDFELWTWRMVTLEDCPQSEVEQLREEIRAVWDDPEQKEYWTQRIRDEAVESLLLQGMAKGITERIKQQVREEKSNAAT